MNQLNIEIKAKSNNHDEIRNILESRNALFRGLDNQIDTYFKVKSGRLKLREGNIENYLIHYNRENKQGPKESNVVLLKTEPNSPLKDILTKHLGILVVVNKKREIYTINNVKFHLDSVKDLGTYVEIEAIGSEAGIGKERLLEQCSFYQDLFKIDEQDLISVSYSDLLLKE